jgi:hypothetical protein
MQRSQINDIIFFDQAITIDEFIATEKNYVPNEINHTRQLNDQKYNYISSKNAENLLNDALRLNPNNIKLARFIHKFNLPIAVQFVDERYDNFYSEGEIEKREISFFKRNPSLIRDAKNAFKKKHGKLFCEACNFDFQECFGESGVDFIEAHHNTPLSESQSERKSSITDLSMLCSNCHRMVHRNKDWEMNIQLFYNFLKKHHKK